MGTCRFAWPRVGQSSCESSSLTRPSCAWLGVRSLSGFGSVARDEAGPDSDVDLLVEFEQPVGFFGLFRLQDEIESWLQRPIVLVTIGGLRPDMRDRVLREGAVLCWGTGCEGQLGDGTTESSPIPLRVVGLGPPE